MTTLQSSDLRITVLASGALLLGVLLALCIWRGRRERAALHALVADLREREAALRCQIDAARSQPGPPGEMTPAAPTASARQVSAAADTRNLAPESHGAAFSILVAEDNPVNRAMALRQLERLGYVADSVINGREAVEAVRRQRYDLIFMDLQMPELDGNMATRAIRDLGDAVHQPIIVAVTANVMDGDRDRCLAAGMDDYLSKPVLIADLRLALGRAAPSGSPQQPSSPGYDCADLINVVSIAATIDTFSDDYAEAREILIGLYRNEISAQIEGLAQAVDMHNRDGVRQAAHKLLGGCRQLGATGMASRCAALEQSSADAPLTDLARQIADIRSCYHATMHAVLTCFSQVDGEMS